LKEKWKDENFQRKQKEACHTTPNKPETLIQTVLNRLYPNEWKYTGDWSFWINGRNPDFTCTNGKKLLIEHFGTYWHEGDNPEELKKIYSEFGYKTLVIWESELKDMKKTESEIKDFIENS
jgi:G:T-mismatch repair DNA endonuclease (very short patch repair protein)